MDSEHNIPKRNEEESLSVALKTELESWRNISILAQTKKENNLYIKIYTNEMYKKLKHIKK